MAARPSTPSAATPDTDEVAASIPHWFYRELYLLVHDAGPAGITRIKKSPPAMAGCRCRRSGAVRATLESGGVEFIDEDGGGPRVRLRRPPKQKR